jgi:hypothetical protein
MVGWFILKYKPFYASAERQKMNRWGKPVGAGSD